MTKTKSDGEQISPALDPAATILTMPEAFAMLKTSRLTGYKFIEDGLLETFLVGVRRYCTVAQVQDCARRLVERGLNKTKPSEKPGPQYGRPAPKAAATLAERGANPPKPSERVGAQYGRPKRTQEQSASRSASKKPRADARASR